MNKYYPFPKELNCVAWLEFDNGDRWFNTNFTGDLDKVVEDVPHTGMEVATHE